MNLNVIIYKNPRLAALAWTQFSKTSDSPLRKSGKIKLNQTTYFSKP
jgi:hypothetical protein